MSTGTVHTIIVLFISLIMSSERSKFVKLEKSGRFPFVFNYKGVF